MKIAIYTLTRDRLEYTKRAFDALHKNAGIAFDHYVIDNGSTDGTADWLIQVYKPFYCEALSENTGISAGSNTALASIFDLEHPYRPNPISYDLIVKMDNDCLIITPNLLERVAGIYQARGPYAARYVLSPRVSGITNQPRRGGVAGLGNHTIGLTSTVGGLFHIVPAEIYREYRYPDVGTLIDTKPITMAWGQDDHFCRTAKALGAVVGYIEELEVQHMDGTDGQARRYPDYFRRKWAEEKDSRGRKSF